MTKRADFETVPGPLGSPWTKTPEPLARAAIRAAADRGVFCYFGITPDPVVPDRVLITTQLWVPRFRAPSKPRDRFIGGARAFANFLACCVDAMAWRCALRKAAGHAPYTGSTPSSGEHWTALEVARAHDAYWSWIRLGPDAPRARWHPFADPRKRPPNVRIGMRMPRRQVRQGEWFRYVEGFGAHPRLSTWAYQHAPEGHPEYEQATHQDRPQARAPERDYGQVDWRTLWDDEVEVVPAP